MAVNGGYLPVLHMVSYPLCEKTLQNFTISLSNCA
jgi:hypothetical protein